MDHQRIRFRWGNCLSLCSLALAGCTGSVADRGSHPPVGGPPLMNGSDGSVSVANPGTQPGTGGGTGVPGVGGSTGGPGVVTQCTMPGVLSPGPAPLRRLTHGEYDNTVGALLGDSSRPARAFPLEEEAYNFTNNATVRSVSQILAEQYENAATKLATTATANLGTLLGCDAVASGEDTCAAQFIDSFGMRTYRRPLHAAEKASLGAFYQTAKAENGFSNAIQMVAAAVLQTPQFLYRMETAESAGAPVPGVPGLIESGQYERATRLSYLLGQSMPDAELLGAASRSELANKEQLAVQARRLLTLPLARTNVVNFHAQWLDFIAMGTLTKDAQLFPTFTPAIAALMQQEAEAFVEHTVFDGAGDLVSLLSSPQTYLNDTLAAFYGAPVPGSATALTAVRLPATERSGLLTLNGLLAGHSNPQQGNPVRRGFFVRDALFCQKPLDPPKGANIVLPAFDPALSTRERFAAHSSDPACKSCHQLMDPIGFGFEHYDAVGMWRAEESGKPVDASGELASTDVDGPFVGAVELGQKLNASKLVSDCATAQWFRYAYGRLETQEDACTLEQLKTAFSASKGNVQELLVALTQTDAFLYRKTP